MISRQRLHKHITFINSFVKTGLFDVQCLKLGYCNHHNLLFRIESVVLLLY
jgi:hypothetical protein